MEKRRINKPIPPVPQTIGDWPSKGEKITVHEPNAKGAFVDKNIAPFMAPADRSKRNILDTPGPYTREWLNRHGLKVVYAHGRATLQYK